VQARFEIAAGDYDHELGRELTPLGFFQSGCHAALIGQLDHSSPVLDHAPVELVASAEQMEDFLSAYVRGWGFPEAIHNQFKSNVRPWFGQPGWLLYLVRVGGRPAAEAVLFMHGGVAYIADCATDPAFRGRGLQVALLGRCIQEAKNANAEFVCSGADFLSTSYRNMERAGLRLLFLRFIWTQLERVTS
jgi:GNAT superfamily N-acetyltransferase